MAVPQLMLRKGDGTITSFREGIAHHVVASLATIGTLAANRTTRLRDYREFFESALAAPTGRSFRRVVIAPGSDPRRTREVIDLLRLQGIEVHRTTGRLALGAARPYLGGGSVRREFPAGSYVIDLAQPSGRLATAILEPSATLDSAFARRQLDRFARNRRRGDNVPREGYEFYDLTAWALPLSEGLDAAWTDEAIGEPGPLVTDADAIAPPAAPAMGRSGYLVPPGSREGQALVLALLREGFAAGVASVPLVADGVDYPAGTVVFRSVRNADSLHARIVALQHEHPSAVIAVQSAFPASGQTGIGAESVEPVHQPRVLVAAGDGVSQTAFGDVWWYLEQELGQPFVPVEPRRLGTMSLDDYNVIILPDGRYASALGPSGMNRLRDWVRGGGALIAFGSAVGLLEEKEVGLREGSPLADSVTKLVAADTALAGNDTRAPFASPAARGNTRPEYVPGAIARASLDPASWLRWGYAGDGLAVMIPGAFLRPSKDGDNVVTFAPDDPVLAGFTWPGNTEKFLPGSVWASVDRAGRGTVIAFADDPLFRAFWRSSAMLFTNAVLFGAGRQ